MSAINSSENDFPRKLQHTPISHTRSAIPRQRQLWKEFLYSLLVKVARGVFQRCGETTLEF